MKRGERGAATRDSVTEQGPGNGSVSRHLLILPDGADNGALAVEQLERALELPHIVLMLVLGNDERARQIVGWALPLCSGTGGASRHPERCVVWIRNPEVLEVRVFLAMRLWLPLPRVAVLNSDDWVKVRLGENDEIDSAALERAFMSGQERRGQRPGAD